MAVKIVFKNVSCCVILLIKKTLHMILYYTKTNKNGMKNHVCETNKIKNKSKD